MSEKKTLVKGALMSKGAVTGVTLAAPTAGAVIGTAASASAGAYGSTAAIAAGMTCAPLIVAGGIVLGAGYLGAKTVGWLFDEITS